jgi:hypothetical protein
MADTVAKVENRTTPKISRKSILRRRHCFYGRYEDRWPFLYELMWSLTSPRAKRISGLLKFSVFTRKRLLQQYRHLADIATERPLCVESRCDAVALGSNISVSAPFVRRCLTGSTMSPFSHPAHR